EYSMLDGAARLKDLFSEVKNQGMTHVAMTDHGNMYGAAEFHRQAKDAGIAPVIGIEAYVAPEARTNSNRVLWGQPHQTKEDVFLELMEHDLDIERRVRDGLLEVGRKLGIPPVVTNDSHYTRESDAESHDLLLCIQTGKTLADTDRFRLEGGGYYIKSAAEMYRLNSSDIWQEGCRNSQLLIADRVDASGMFEFLNLLPGLPIPERS